MTDQLSKRERQIMEVVFRLGEATATEVARLMPKDAGYDSVRVTLRNLEKKGEVTHRRDGRRHVYRPMTPRLKATTKAVRSLVRTFFSGSPSKAILTMLDLSSDRLSPDELREIERWIARGRKS